MSSSPKKKAQMTTTMTREMACELSPLTRADGSAAFYRGDDAAVIACVYGPTDVRISKERIDRATVDVLVKPKKGLPGCASRLKEEVIKNTIDACILGRLFPRTAVNVVVQEIQGTTGGNLLSTSINACCLALLDAGVPLKSTFAAVSCALFRIPDADDAGAPVLDATSSLLTGATRVVVDPCEEEESGADAVLTFAFESTERRVVASHFGGGGGARSGAVLTEERLHECLSLCSEAADAVFEFFRDCVRRKMSINSPEKSKTMLKTRSKGEQSEAER